MASTETVRVSSVCRPSMSVRWVEKYFYLCMSLLIAAVVVYGFSHTVENKLIHANPRRPILLWVHAILFSSWVAFYITQSVLVRIRKVELHRTLGWAGRHSVRPWSWSGLGWQWLWRGLISASCIEQIEMRS
jgi:hypothetical protein